MIQKKNGGMLALVRSFFFQTSFPMAVFSLLEMKQ
jgi:hypothetical protein